MTSWCQMTQHNINPEHNRRDELINLFIVHRPFWDARSILSQVDILMGAVVDEVQHVDVPLNINIIDEISSFLSETGMKKTRFGRLVASDPNLVFDIEAGRDIGMKTVAKILDFIKTHPGGERHDAA